MSKHKTRRRLFTGTYQGWRERINESDESTDQPAPTASPAPTDQQNLEPKPQAQAQKANEREQLTHDTAALWMLTQAQRDGSKSGSAAHHQNAVKTAQSPAQAGEPASTNPMHRFEQQRTVDARGLKCPLPLIYAKLAAEKLAPGEQFELLASDPEAEIDIPAWCLDHGCKCTIDKLSDGARRFTILTAR